MIHQAFPHDLGICFLIPNPVSNSKIELGGNHHVGNVELLLTPCSFGWGGVDGLRLSVEHKLEEPTTDETGLELMHPVGGIHTIEAVARGGIVQDNIIAQGWRCFHGNELSDLELKIIELQAKEVVQFTHGCGRWRGSMGLC